MILQAPLRLRQPKIVTLFVRYGEKAYSDSLERLTEYYRKQGIKQYEVFIIDNSLEPAIDRDMGDGIRLINGDNSFREFSGWDSAITRLWPVLGKADIVHFVTSAFFTHYTGFLDHLTLDQIQLVAKGGICLGHIDAYPAPIELLGEVSQCWIRTCFFFLAAKDLAKALPFTALRDESVFFSDDTRFPFHPLAPLSANYKKYLLDWLTGDGLGHGKWHSQFSLTQESLVFFRQKALSILHEHGLAIRLRKNGIYTVDTAWLKYQMAVTQRGKFRFSTEPIDQCDLRSQLLWGGLQIPENKGRASSELFRRWLSGRS